MQARSINLQKIFEQTICYQIPLFQRPYVWEEEENWQPLWDDVSRLVDHQRETGDVHPHFLGAIVLDQLRGSTGSIETRQVIDGQQRLTTLQLLLAAARDLCRARGHQRFAIRFEKLSRNDASFVDDEHDAFKLWPTNRDREAFVKAHGAGSAAEVRSRFGAGAYAHDVGDRIANAYLYFYRVLEEWLSSTEGEGEREPDDEDKLQERLDALWKVIYSKLLLVVIDLDESDDPQVIFETLNARGTQLLPADLVKNYLFHRAEQEHLPVEKLYETHWRPFDGDYWRHQVKQGRSYRPRIDLFLRHYLTLATKNDVALGHIFGAFRFFADHERPFPKLFPPDEEPEVHTHLRALRTYADVYHRFDAPDPGSRAAVFLDRLRAVDTTTVYPFLLEAFRALDNPEGRDELDQVLEHLESFLIRRMVCGLTMKNYNRLFLELTKQAERRGGVSAASTKAFLMSQHGDSGRWPDDNELRTIWLQQRMYSWLSQYKVRTVLQAIDRALEDGKSESIQLDGTPTIEHVLPVSWRDAWPLPLHDPNDPVERQEKAERRDVLLHTFGNLTLVTNKLNPALSNSPWNVKKPELLKYSKLNLTRYFHDAEDWEEKAIEARGLDLFETARKIWPHPERHANPPLLG